MYYMVVWFGTAVFVLVTSLALDISTAAQEQITAHRRWRFSESALMPVFYRKHF